MADVLPILQLAGPDVHVSRRDAIALLYQLGTAGGSPANPEGAIGWSARAAHRGAMLAAAIAGPPTDEDRAHEARRMARTLERLTALTHRSTRCQRGAHARHWRFTAL
jgi:hypothetical protein